MLKVTELAFCCYAVTDMARARKFYEGVLNLKPTTVSNSEHGQWVDFEAVHCCAQSKNEKNNKEICFEVSKNLKS